MTDSIPPETTPAPGAGEWRGGWRYVAAAMLAVGLGPGLYQNLSSLFSPELEREFGWARGDIATAAGLALAGAAVAPLVGRAADRLGVRRVIVASMLLLGAAHVWFAAMGPALVNYQAGVLLLVLAVPGTSSLVYGKLISTAFVRHRGIALAVGTSGLAVMTIAAAPALAAVIAHHGWRTGFLVLGAGSTLVALPLILLAVRRLPVGPVRLDAAADTPAAPLLGVTAAEARRDPRFWIIVISAALINLATTGLVTQLAPIGLERGLAPAHAALLLTGFGVSAIAGRLVVGALIDRMRPQPVATAVALVSAAAFVALALHPHGLPALLLLVFLAGLMNGAENDLLPFFAARLFGLRAFGEIYGSAIPPALLGTALGIAGFGRLHDWTGNYDLALLVGAGALVLAGASFLLLRDHALPVVHDVAERERD